MVEVLNAADPNRPPVSGTCWVDDRHGPLGRRVAGRLPAGEAAASNAPATTAAAGADVIVWLSAADPDARARQGQSALFGLGEALAASGDARHVVLVSSALVYGAWPNNPVPITEDAPMRPDGEFDYAKQLTTAEWMVDRWRTSAAGRTATILRPAVTVAADGTSGVVRALAAGMGQRRGQDDPPAQFLHLDDLASAVALAAERHLDGVYNVAPDGWIQGERVRALAGAAPRLKVPDRVSEVVTSLRWRFQRGPIPPGLRSYTRWPWLIANDRLRAEGWRPEVTNEQAYVEGTDAKWFTMISPKRRQELSLGASAALVAVAAAWLIRIVRRHRSR